MALIIPNFRKGIRAKEVANITAESFKVDNVHVITYGSLKKTIADKKTLSVLVVRPDSSDYKTIESILSDKDKTFDLNEEVYVYPIFYKLDSEMDDLKIDHESMMIYFENGVEANRIQLNSITDLKEGLVASLNSLSMANIKSVK